MPIFRNRILQVNRGSTSDTLRSQSKIIEHLKIPKICQFHKKLDGSSVFKHTFIKLQNLTSLDVTKLVQFFILKKNVDFWWLKNVNMYLGYFSHQGLFFLSTVLKLMKVEPNILNTIYFKKRERFFTGNWDILVAKYALQLLRYINILD